MSKQHQKQHPSNPSAAHRGDRAQNQESGASQQKPNLHQGADAMSQHPEHRAQDQRKPNLSQGADAMSRRPDASDTPSDAAKDQKE